MEEALSDNNDPINVFLEIYNYDGWFEKRGSSTLYKGFSGISMLKIFKT